MMHIRDAWPALAALAALVRCAGPTPEPRAAAPAPPPRVTADAGAGGGDAGLGDAAPLDPLVGAFAARGRRVARVERRPGEIVVTLAQVSMPEGAAARTAAAEALAREAAPLLGVPGSRLDRVEVARPSCAEVLQVTLSEADPPLDAECIEASLTARVAAEADGAAEIELTARCPREPPQVGAPPADASRALPRAARGPVPYLAECYARSFADGVGRGLVVDARGDVWAYEGPSVLAAPAVSPRELGRRARHGRRYAGALAAADADALAARARAVSALSARESRLASHPEDAFCALYLPGAGGALSPVVLETRSPRGDTSREGPAADEVRAILARARALAGR